MNTEELCPITGNFLFTLVIRSKETQSKRSSSFQDICRFQDSMKTITAKQRLKEMISYFNLKVLQQRRRP